MKQLYVQPTHKKGSQRRREMSQRKRECHGGRKKAAVAGWSGALKIYTQSVRSPNES